MGDQKVDVRFQAGVRVAEVLLPTSLTVEATGRGR
jgi:hypothetical protein